MSQKDEMKELERQMLAGEGAFSEPEEDLAIYGEQYPGGELTPIMGLKERPKIKRIGKTGEL